MSVQTINYATQSICMVSMTIFFGLRVFSRLKILKGFTIEDWFCLGAYILGMCYSVIALLMGHFGGGLHVDEVSASDLISFSKTVYVTMVMYGPTAFLTKISLLWIMTRVFNPSKTAVYLIYSLIGFTLAYYIPVCLIKIKICTPISRFWLGPSAGGSCLNEGAIILADSVISVVSDLMILVLPLPLTLRLQMPVKKKLRVMGILGAGGLAFASSVIRLVFIVQFGNSPDATYAFMRINMFGNAEISIGVICACLPALSALMTTYSREYSTGNKATSDSHYQMNKMKGHSRSHGTKESKSRLTFMELGSDDQYMLVSHAQAEPKVETSIHSDPEGNAQGHRESFDKQGIVKSVEVSTTYDKRP